MKASHKKEYLTILIIVVMAFLVGLYSSLHAKPQYVRQSAQEMVLPAEDFVIKAGSGTVTAGRSTFQEVTALFPQGKILGLSTIYRPEGAPFFFEFSKKDNILTVVQIEGKSLSTSRGINVGDTLEQVVAAYGGNYSSTIMNGAGLVDMSYGQTDKVIFKINENKVSKIVVQHQVVK